MAAPGSAAEAPAAPADQDGLQRLPAGVDEELADLPAAGPEALAWLEAAIGAARAEMAAAAGEAGAELYSREWAPAPPRRAPRGFVVLQFNALAEGLSAPPSATPPFPDGARPSEWGGFTHLPCRDVSLAWQLRRWRLLEEILRHGPDLIALEELDHFDDFWRPVLAAAGFEGRWLAKRNSPCLGFGYHSDGSALFWKTNMFAPAREEFCAMTRMKEEDGEWANQGLIAVDLIHQSSGEALRFAATHLKAKPGEENERKRAIHVAQMVEALSAGSPPGHTVFCGDFNTDPFDVEGSHAARAVPLVLSSTQLAHAYPLPQDASGGEYTTWKRRGEGESRHWIDYIFHSSGLQTSSLLQMPLPENVGPERLPSCRYPSDHVAIAAEFEFSDCSS